MISRQPARLGTVLFRYRRFLNGDTWGKPALTSQLASDTWRIPTGFPPKAQSCEARATLGNNAKEILNPNGVESWIEALRPQPCLGWTVSNRYSQGSSFFATLGWVAQSRWDWLNQYADLRDKRRVQSRVHRTSDALIKTEKLSCASGFDGRERALRGPRPRAAGGTNGTTVLDLAKSVPRLHGAVTAQRAIPTHCGFRVKLRPRPRLSFFPPSVRVLVAILASVLWLAGPVQSQGAAAWQRGPGFRFMEIQANPGNRGSTPTATPQTAGFTDMSTARAGITFSNTLPTRLMTENYNLMNGSGVAAGDFDGDGWCDLYFCAINGTNALYRNRGNWQFEDVTATAGLRMAGLHSTGAILSDIDGDGDLDLLVATLGSGVHSFANEGNGRFRETTGEAGLVSATGSMSLAMADVDGDGDLDLYVANYGALSIFRAGGQAEVKQVNGQWVVTGPYASRLRMVDGRLEEVGEPDVLYLNDGQGHFRAVPWNSEFFLDEDGRPMPEPWDYGLSVQFRDINGDGFPDIYVCNDFQTVDRVWINDGRGHFRALPRLAMRKQSYSSMGVDFADVDRDGVFDFFVTEMMSRDPALRMRQVSSMQPAVPIPGRIDNRPEVVRNTFFHGRGDGTYAELANFSGVAASDWSWAPVFLDVDLDGYEDLLVGNGAAFDVQDRDTIQRIRFLGKQTPEQSRTNLLMYSPFLSPNAAFRNQRGLTFEEVSTAWRFDSRRISHGIALADLDNDGDLDMAINCLNDRPLLYRNDASAPRLSVRLQGAKPNRQGIGGLIRVFGGPVPVQMQEILGGGRYVSGDDAVRVFAAGNATNDLTIEVLWRSGRTSVVRNARANRIYVIEEEAASAATTLPRSIPTPATGETNSNFGKPLFQDVSQRLGHVHREELFNDYVRQPLLMKHLSQLGPGVAWFDLNGDGVDELILGASRGGALEVFRKDEQGGFIPVRFKNPQPAPDDLSGLAAWTSSDGQRALLVGIANYEVTTNKTPSVLRCSVADASPTPLQIDAMADIASSPSSTGPLAVADIDGDGDLDLFVGGRLIPGGYPQAASSRIFRQENGKLAPDEINNRLLEKMGLVSGAVWSDLDRDGFPELVLACEWGPIRIFKNARGHLKAWDAPVTLVSQPSTLNHLTGWWSGVATGDLDGDGQLDIIATNWGLNDAYQASPEHPLPLYFGNLAGRGVVDLIEAYYSPELKAEVPRRSLNALGQAFPSLAEHYPTHRAFSTATLPDLLGLLPYRPEKVAVTTLASMVFLNRGTNFIAAPLPPEAQFSPAFAVNVADADGDGREDIFLSQNFFAVRPEWVRLDGGRSLWLRGDGKGAMTPLPGLESGVAVYGEQRGAALGDFNDDGRVDLVVTQNGAATCLFENVGARPGLRVRFKGPVGNPLGIGAIARLQFGERFGAAREVHGGSGYWSQDSVVPVLGCPEAPTHLQVLWPGGKTVVSPIPAGSREVVVDEPGNVVAAPSASR
jgi:hypothetical protein